MPIGLALGRLRSEASESRFSADCDALAVGGRDYSPIYLASVIGPQTTIKAIAAALNNSRAICLSATDCGDCCPDYGLKARTFMTHNAHGYNCHKTKLGYDTWHMLAVSRDPKFLATYSVDAVMQKLMSQEYTTPLLKSWGPKIVESLTSADYLTRLVCFQCDCGLLSLDDDKLDEVVSCGVSQNLFPMMKESV